MIITFIWRCVFVIEMTLAWLGGWQTKKLCSPSSLGPSLKHCKEGWPWNYIRPVTVVVWTDINCCSSQLTYVIFINYNIFLIFCVVIFLVSISKAICRDAVVYWERHLKKSLLAQLHASNTQDRCYHICSRWIHRPAGVLWRRAVDVIPIMYYYYCYDYYNDDY